MSDCLIVGAGVVGLSLAYELAGHGLRVHVVDAGQAGREASWAGAGILPPASADVADPVEQLAALSNAIHAVWSAELREATEIDNGYRATGAVYLARRPAEAEELAHFAAAARGRGIEVQQIASSDLASHEPALAPSGEVRCAYLVPGECQIRNPRHLKALQIGCLRRGVQITPCASVEDFEVRGSRIVGVRTTQGPMAAETICLTSGAWTGMLAEKLNTRLAVRPIRGQIALLSLPRPLLGRIINEGPRYLVPRADGRILVGSTEEDVGFDRGTTAGALQGLLQFAFSLAPSLQGATLERSWAGLRPATADGLPYLGRLAAWDNAFIAAGHFRGGLQLSTGTARLVGQLIRGERPQIDLARWSVDRPASAATAARVPTSAAPA